MTSKLATVREYFHLLENFVTDADAFRHILHPEARQREFPNALNRHGQESDLADMLRRMQLGSTMLAGMKYEIVHSVEGPDDIVVEALWTGTMAKDAGPLKAGQEVKAHVCVVCAFKDGKIFRQRNYDCFEPF